MKNKWVDVNKLCSVSVTNGNCVSLCIVVFLTNDGAFNAILSILSICVCDAKFYIEHAYCQFGLIYHV
jgi:hypothetical protein